jgi:hypothetical protein
MKRIPAFVALLALLLPLIVVEASILIYPRKFDEFKDINCEDEMARLDNFALSLRETPDAKGVVVFYGGRRFRGRLPKRGDAAARAARLNSYLTHRRGIPTEQVILIDGGYREEWTTELWIVPSAATLPSPTPSVPPDKIKFRKGKARARDFRCQI